MFKAELYLAVMVNRTNRRLDTSNMPRSLSLFLNDHLLLAESSPSVWSRCEGRPDGDYQEAGFPQPPLMELIDIQKYYLP